jgi:Na+-driven multidrug efflux pump
MKISILSGALNVVFNFIFLKIIPLGVAGAAIGSICASIVGIVLYVVFIRTKMSILIPKREDMHLDKSLVKPLLTSGFVMMSQGAIVQVASLVRQIAVNGFDEYVVTGMSTGDKLIYFSWMIIMSFESALIYFAAQNSGAGKISRIKDGWKYTLTVTFVIAALIAALFIGFGKYFYGLFLGFGDDVATVSVTEYAGSYVISQMIFFPFMALLSSTRGAVKGMGKNLATVMCGVLELVACALSVLIVNLVPMSQSLKLGVIYLSLPLAWILTSLVVLVLFIRAIKKKREESLLVLNS